MIFKNFFFYFGDGELGNQIFQYCFIRSHTPKNSIVITCSFQELSNFIDFNDDIKIFIIKNKIVRYFCIKLANRFLKIFAKLRLISSTDVDYKIYKNTTIEGKKIIKLKGFFPLTYIYPRYFQNEFFFKSKVVNALRVKNLHKIKCQEFIKKIPSNCTPVAVHVRSQIRNSNEIETFKIFGQSTALPIDYFYDCINWFDKKLRNPFYIILSDNPNYVKEKFSHLKNKVFSKNDINVDLLIISTCSYGILSNSSVSWWGSYLSGKRKIFFAPMYWMGWRSKLLMQGYGVPSYCSLIDPNKYKDNNYYFKLSEVKKHEY